MTFVCSCGNTADKEGFYPVDDSGQEIDDVDADRYRCAVCKKEYYLNHRTDEFE